MKCQLRNRLQSGQSFEESENRINTLKGMFLQKKDGQVWESSDDIHKIDGMENTEQSVQENQSDERDKRNDPVYKLHVHVDSGNEDDNDVKSVVAEIKDKVVHKIDDEEKDDQDVETVTKDCEVGDKLSDVHRASIGQMLETQVAMV